ncbi:MAG: glycosyltransferase [Verrucomicrobiota bacterium]
MPAPLLLDLSHTSHTQARTGIQRVARSLYAALSSRAVAITHDPHRAMWRLLEAWEFANLNSTAPAAKRGARWPLSARLRGHLRQLVASRASAAAPAGLEARLAAFSRSCNGLLVPELFSPAVAGALPALFAKTRGARVAVFHDAIALKFPELTPSKTVARFPAYLRELLAFDGIAAVSDDSRDALRDYWRWLGVTDTPVLETIPLGIDTHAGAARGENHPALPASPATGARSAGPVVLSVGSIEGRKNHLALLEACEALWAGGHTFTLHLVGMAQPQTAAAALARIEALRAAGRPLRYDGPVDEAALEAAYAGCTFMVYPSMIEGFGLPVLESVAHGRPCICSARGALGESARGGGCVALPSVDAASLATAMAQLLGSPTELAALTAAARARHLRTWSDYADDLCQWVATVPRRASPKPLL